MPMVGGEEFLYSKKGFVDAKKAATDSGKKMSFGLKKQKKSAMNGVYSRT